MSAKREPSLRQDLAAMSARFEAGMRLHKRNATTQIVQEGPRHSHIDGWRAQIKAISQAKAAADIGQFCNALQWRFGLSAAVAERLMVWMAQS